MSFQIPKYAQRDILLKNFGIFCRFGLEALGAADLAESKDSYLSYLFREFTEILTGRCKRALVNLPPRHGKTKLAMCLAAAEFARCPQSEVLVVCYNVDLARAFSNGVRKILRAPCFVEAFGPIIAHGQDRSGDFRTARGGGLFATSFESSATGRGADLVIIDDPHKSGESLRPDQLRIVHELFEREIMTRPNNPALGRFVVLGQRVHRDDLSAYLLSRGGWHHIQLPLVATGRARFRTLDGNWDREQGTVLRPDAFPPAVIEELAKSPSFGMNWQQGVDRGAHIDASDFDFHPEPPRCAYGSVLSIDPAFGHSRSASSSALQEWLSDGSRYYLLDERLEQLAPEALARAALRHIKLSRISRVLVEDATIGRWLASYLEQRVPEGVMVHLIAPRGSKSERLARVMPLLKAHLVSLPEGAPWVPVFMEDCEAFPDGPSDDRIDAMCQALEWGQHNVPPPARPTRSVGVVANKFGVSTPTSSFPTGSRRALVWAPKRK